MVDVIIPIFNAFNEVQACLARVVKNSPPHANIILIDDASTDFRIRALLNDLSSSGDGRLQVLYNEVNQGFVRTVNRGLLLSKNDVVLLNSDTLVPPAWLENLQACAQSRPQVGTVTPFSNNAEICSYPVFCRETLVANLDLTDLEAALKAVDDGNYPEIPTAVGFCMYIRRELIDRIGVFDAERFGQGYGEENDFCMRATAAGFYHLLCTNTYVVHRGGRSFQAETQTLKENNLKALLQLYPDYSDQIAEFVAADPIQPYRQRVVDKLAEDGKDALGRPMGPGILLITHRYGGGVDRHVMDLVEMLASSVRVEVLRPLGLNAIALDDSTGNRRVFDVKRWEELVDILRSRRYARCHIHHLHGYPVAILKLPQALDIPYDLTLHDFGVFCPQYSLTTSNSAYCGEPPPTGCNECLRERPHEWGLTIEDWRERMAGLLGQAHRVISPSAFVSDRVKQRFPAIQILMRPHPPRHEWLAASPPAIKVMILGGLSRAKGLDNVLACAWDAKSKALPISFVVVGYPERGLPTFPDLPLHITGEYSDEDLLSLMEYARPDCIWFPGQNPESYSYTLNVALQCGLPIVAGHHLGALTERLRASSATHRLIDASASAGQLNETFLDLGRLNQAERRHPEPNPSAVELRADYRTWILSELSAASTEVSPLVDQFSAIQPNLASSMVIHPPAMSLSALYEQAVECGHKESRISLRQQIALVENEQRVLATISERAGKPWFAHIEDMGQVAVALQIQLNDLEAQNRQRASAIAALRHEIEKHQESLRQQLKVIEMRDLSVTELQNQYRALADQSETERHELIQSYERQEVELAIASEERLRLQHEDFERIQREQFESFERIQREQFERFERLQHQLHEKYEIAQREKEDNFERIQREKEDNFETIQREQHENYERVLREKGENFERDQRELLMRFETRQGELTAAHEAALRLAVQTATDQLTAYYEQSKSWRITAPVRAFRSSLASSFHRISSLAHLVKRGWRRWPVAYSIVREEGVGALASRVQEKLSPPAPPTLQKIETRQEVIAGLTLATCPPGQKPQVSVVIPVYGQHQYTYNCLLSMSQHTQLDNVQIIVIDDCSPEPAQNALAHVTGVQWIRNAVNLGFIGSCNAAALQATGEYLVLLNNDVQVTPGWLQALLSVFDARSDCGMVGARLVYPDGRLQEAGGIVWQDGSAWNWGRDQDPEHPRYNYLRKADYCSGACLALRKTDWNALNGFERAYTPAYYEDTDLAFRVRQAGKVVYYQPQAKVVHFEGVTSGTDENKGVKRHQIINQITFFERWRDTLKSHRPNGVQPWAEATRSAKMHVLVVEACMLTPDQDAGSVRMLAIMELMTEMGVQVSFVADNLEYRQPYVSQLQQTGIEVWHRPHLRSVAQLLEQDGAHFDVIIFCRHYIANQYVGQVRQYAPQARIWFDTVDLHYLREERLAELQQSAKLAEIAADTKRQELGVMEQSDLTFVVSPVELGILAQAVPSARVEILSLIHEPVADTPDFKKRNGLLFVGGFQHPPNVDAVNWFIKEVWPLLIVELPDISLRVVGSKMPDSMRELAQPGIEILGFVQDIDPLLHSSKVSIAPLRYGAGVKGKVNQALSYGLPVVATSTGIEGMYLDHEKNVLVGDTPAAFAQAIVRLHRDEILWNTLSEGGKANIRQTFSRDVASKTLHRLLALPVEAKLQKGDVSS
jgi:GT2 family glycosyltransferase/glycosyltransferase involved in cell wall biosynthesis